MQQTMEAALDLAVLPPEVVSLIFRDFNYRVPLSFLAFSFLALMLLPGRNYVCCRLLQSLGTSSPW
jgi:hypothetical protein